MNFNEKDQSENPLGKQVSFSDSYDRNLLFRIERQARNKLNFKFGFDRWFSYELTYLSVHSCPQSCALEIIIPAQSKFIVESKSLKLYLASFSQEKISAKELARIIRIDLSKLLDCDQILVNIIELDHPCLQISLPLKAVSIDDKQLVCNNFSNPLIGILQASNDLKHETLISNIFRSICPVTAQPDYASLLIEYRGKNLKHSSLLQYLAAYRNHAGFHETCCEKIFEDIFAVVKPEFLSVACFFNRRGGIEINPVRSTEELRFENLRYRFPRQ